MILLNLIIRVACYVIIADFGCESFVTLRVCNLFRFLTFVRNDKSGFTVSETQRECCHFDPELVEGEKSYFPSSLREIQSPLETCPERNRRRGVPQGRGVSHL